jgi:hypothetical protein
MVTIYTTSFNIKSLYVRVSNFRDQIDDISTAIRGRAIAQAGPGIDSRSGHVEFAVKKVARWPGFLRVLRFPLPILILPSTLYNLDTDSVGK